jgi:hypothetical protein
MHFIDTKTHGVIDYLVGLLLILLPYLFGFATGGAKQWVPMLLGIAIIGMSLLTAYELGAVKLIPMPVHLGADVVSALLLGASPWLFGFADQVYAPHLVVAIMEIVVIALTSAAPARAMVAQTSR